MYGRSLSEKRTFAAFPVILYKPFDFFPCAAKLQGETVNAQEFIRSTVHKLSVNGYIVIKKRRSAFLAVLIISH